MAGRGVISLETAISHLPPLSVAPILEYYDGEIGTLAPERLLEAPVDDRGVVDIFATVEKALALVDPDYTFPKGHCDVHHFVWERADYMPPRHNGNTVPNQYREIPFHKGYLPRQLHNFMHVVVAPPVMPTLEVMERRVESYEVAKRLFATARSALQFERLPLGALPPKKRWRREQLLEEHILSQILANLQGRYERELGLVPEDTEFIDVESIREHTIVEAATRLGRVAARDSVNLLPYIYANRPVAA